MPPLHHHARFLNASPDSITITSSHTVACCLDVPASFRNKAAYALQMLLLPLGIELEWIARNEVSAGALYYGPEPPEAAALALAYAHEAPSFFAAAHPRSPQAVRWMSMEGTTSEAPLAQLTSPTLFHAPDGSPDLVVSAFYWLSGWHEYAATERDRFGRFPFAASLFAALGISPTHPVVDAYREHLTYHLHATEIPFTPRTWADSSWALCPTHDIDYLKKWRKGMIWREVVHYLLRNDRSDPLPQRLSRFRRFLVDLLSSGDVYRHALETMPQVTQAVGGTATYFFKTGAHGKRDVPYNPTSAYVRRQIASLLERNFEVGLHPSFFAHDHAGYMQEERKVLAALLPEPPTSVRQHYLRWQAPQTPRLHQHAGFTIDSTLGFAETIGFRRGTCHPFLLYDLAADHPLPVWEMPLALMESAVFNRMHLDLPAANRVTSELLATCRRYGGVCVGLWHNTLWDELDYPGWGAHFEATLEEAAQASAHIGALKTALKSYLNP